MDWEYLISWLFNYNDDYNYCQSNYYVKMIVCIIIILYYLHFTKLFYTWQYKKFACTMYVNTSITHCTIFDDLIDHVLKQAW